VEGGRPQTHRLALIAILRLVRANLIWLNQNTALLARRR
jgi:hypothetical protein